MGEQANSKVPRIRFKGCDEAWVKKRISEVADVYDGTHQTPNYTKHGVMFLSVENIRSLRSDKFISEKAFEDFKVVPQNGDILMTRIGDIGTANVVESNERIAYYVSLALLKLKGLAPYFLKQCISSNSVIEELRHRTLHIAFPKKINKNEIEKVVISLPQLRQEQTQIGEYFRELDRLLELHQRKHDKLVALKKAMLQKMFPQPGATTPEIRFKGFSRDWVKKKLGESVLIQRGGSPRPIESFITLDDNGINWVKIGDVKIGSRYITQTEEKIKPEGVSKSREVFKGDLILSNSMSFGRPYLMAIDGCIHDGWLLIRNDKDLFDLNYLLQLLSSEAMTEQYRSLAAGGVVNNLNSALVQSTNIAFPDKSEQQKIGTYFRTLDALISKHATQRQKLQHIKSACLEKMFV